MHFSANFTNQLTDWAILYIVYNRNSATVIGERILDS
jgi:hypothetical protein